MRTSRRILLILFALLCAAAGATGAWFALTIPNDIRAEGLLKEARTHASKGERQKTQQALEKIVREHPRTDAAAAAAQTLFHMQNQEREQLTRRLDAMEKTHQRDRQRISSLETRVTELAKKPPPPPPAPVVKKAPPKKTVVRRAPTKKKTTPKRRRR